MPSVIDVEDSHVTTLPECVDLLSSRGFNPTDRDNLHQSALTLRRLGNDRNFLGDMLVENLKAGRETAGGSYGPSVIMLHPPGSGNFFMRAVIWPSENEYAMRASGSASFVYGMPHDHNFDFLTLGYFGPGYWSDYYEYDYEEVAGWSGEPVDLRFAGRKRLEPGKIMHYRAHRDVHLQLPADELSVSLNIMHGTGAQGWLDQYSFDLEEGRVGRILSHGSGEAFMRIAVGLGGEEALDLTHRFGSQHPSDRMRWHCWSALASIITDDAESDALWARAEKAGSRLVAHEAQLRRKELAQRHTGAAPELTL